MCTKEEVVYAFRIDNLPTLYEKAPRRAVLNVTVYHRAARSIVHVRYAYYVRDHGTTRHVVFSERMNTSKASTVLNTIMRSLQNDHHVPQNLNNSELPEDITLHAISVFRSCRGEGLDFDLLRRVYEHR